MSHKINTAYTYQPLEHSHKFVCIRKMCKFYTIFPKNDSHKSVYKCANLQFCNSNRILYFVVYSFFTYLENEERK